ncbi:MAG: maleylpyruvate isomerase N-terminal domain-containing protein, partial [Pseudomonadota bacterium]
MQQATDFLDESMALAALLEPLSEADFDRPTQFKGWTINNVIRHLHVWNIAVDLSLQDEEAFGAFVSAMM